MDEVKERLDFSEACYTSIKNTFLKWVLESDSIQNEKEMLIDRFFERHKKDLCGATSRSVLTVSHAPLNQIFREHFEKIILEDQENLKNAKDRIMLKEKRRRDAEREARKEEERDVFVGSQ